MKDSLGTISIWRHQHFDNFVTTTHLSHHVITKLGIPYHLPTCYQLSSLREAKKKNKQIKKVAVVFFSSFTKAKQKGNLFFSFWAKPKKNEQVKKEVVVFLKQKGNVFFSFRATQKKGQTNKVSFLVD